jgi:hypothetical protein
MNVNIDESYNSIERHAYCLCLHVRPATIFVALVNLVLNELIIISKIDYNLKN